MKIRKAVMTGVRREHDAGVTLGVVARRTLVVALVAGFVFLAWYLRHTIVLGFAAVVVAAILVSSADLVNRVAPLERPWSVAVAGLLILVFIGLVFWLAWPQLQTQSSTLFERLSGAAANLEDRTGVALPGSFPQLAQDTGRGLFSRILSDVARMVQTAASAITGLILVSSRASSWPSTRASIGMDSCCCFHPTSISGQARRWTGRVRH